MTCQKQCFVFKHKKMVHLVRRMLPILPELMGIRERESGELRFEWILLTREFQMLQYMIRGSREFSVLEHILRLIKWKIALLIAYFIDTDYLTWMWLQAAEIGVIPHQIRVQPLGVCSLSSTWNWHCRF
jgi:hypothetical protein